MDDPWEVFHRADASDEQLLEAAAAAGPRDAASLLTERAAVHGMGPSLALLPAFGVALARSARRSTRARLLDGLALTVARGVEDAHAMRDGDPEALRTTVDRARGAAVVALEAAGGDALPLALAVRGCCATLEGCGGGDNQLLAELSRMEANADGLAAEADAAGPGSGWPVAALAGAALEAGRRGGSATVAAARVGTRLLASGGGTNPGALAGAAAALLPPGEWLADDGAAAGLVRALAGVATRRQGDPATAAACVTVLRCASSPALQEAFGAALASRGGDGDEEAWLLSLPSLCVLLKGVAKERGGDPGWWATAVWAAAGQHCARTSATLGLEEKADPQRLACEAHAAAAVLALAAYARARGLDAPATVLGGARELDAAVARALAAGPPERVDDSQSGPPPGLVRLKLRKLRGAAVAFTG